MISFYMFTTNVCYIINQLTFSDLTLHWVPTYLEMEGINPFNMRSFQEVKSLVIVYRGEWIFL